MVGLLYLLQDRRLSRNFSKWKTIEKKIITYVFLLGFGSKQFHNLQHERVKHTINIQREMRIAGFTYFTKNNQASKP